MNIIEKISFFSILKINTIINAGLSNMERNEPIQPEVEHKSLQPDVEQVNFDAERLKDERKVLKEIVKQLQLLFEIRSEEKNLSDTNDVSQDSILQAIKIFKLFDSRYLSETVGGIKRATESSIPWDELKYLAVSLDDPEVMKEYQGKLIQIFDVELLELHEKLKDLLKKIETTIFRYDCLVKISRAIKILSERIAQADDIIILFESIKNVPVKSLSEEVLDEIYNESVKYKKKRQEDRQENYELKLNIDGKNFNVKYLGDVKNKGFISTFEEYENMYKDAETKEDKKATLQKIIESLEHEIKTKHGLPKKDLEQKYKSLSGTAKISVIGKIELINIKEINESEYNKRVIKVMVALLKLGVTLNPKDEIHKIAILDTIARIGELEKKCTFIIKTSKWISFRTLLYHAVDTKDAILKFQSLLTNDKYFEDLIKAIMEKYSLLSIYVNDNFSPTSGFLKKNADQLTVNESIDFLNDLLQKPQDNNVRKNEMIKLQLPSLEKYELIASWIISIITAINRLSGEKLQSYEEIFKENKVLELYACFMFKLIGEAFKFIEELEIKDSDNNLLSDFYNKHYNFFAKVRQLRGEMAHSPEFITPSILNTAIQLIEKEGLSILEILKDIYNVIHSSPSATFKH